MLGWLIAIAVAALIVALADRATALAVRYLMATTIQIGTGSAARPAISFAGRAFLPQFAAGRYREIRVSVGACAVGGLGLCAVNARLTEVRAPLAWLARARKASPGQVAILVGGLDATAVIGLAELSERLPAGLRLLAQGADLRITGTYLLMPVRGTLAVTASRDRIVITPKLRGVSASIDFAIALPALPDRLGVASVRVTDVGLEVDFSGTGVELRNPSAPG